MVCFTPALRGSVAARFVGSEKVSESKSIERSFSPYLLGSPSPVSAADFYVDSEFRIFSESRYFMHCAHNLKLDLPSDPRPVRPGF